MADEPQPDIPKESSRTILFQFVFFPLGVVLIGVAVFFLFGKLASEEHSVPDYEINPKDRIIGHAKVELVRWIDRDMDWLGAAA